VLKEAFRGIREIQRSKAQEGEWHKIFKEESP
jgi:hypothetical protein